MTASCIGMHSGCNLCSLFGAGAPFICKQGVVIIGLVLCPHAHIETFTRKPNLSLLLHNLCIMHRQSESN